MQREAEEEDQTGIFNVKEERVKTKSNEARAMEIEAQMFEAKRDRARWSWMEKSLKYKLSKAEDMESKDEIEGEEHVRFLGEKLCKCKGVPSEA